MMPITARTIHPISKFSKKPNLNIHSGKKMEYIAKNGAT